MMIGLSQKKDELTGFGSAPSAVRHRDSPHAKGRHLMPDRIAYMPLNTYPEAAPDAAILASVGFAASLGCGLHVSTFAVDIPPVASPLGGFLINVDGMAQAVEDRSKAECERLKALIEGVAKSKPETQILNHRFVVGAALGAAISEARYFDLTLLPWAAETQSAQDMSQALVFDSGVPVILVPPTTIMGPVNHVAIAWDESRVAARALGDVLRILPAGGRVTVVTVHDEKALNGTGLAQTLASSLNLRGYEAHAVDLTLDGKSIATALQEAALAEGAQLLAMGGFGHSRLRDFILGGATKGVLADLRLPVLLSH
jgi:nucleotide-binding universal stress UspA family protein